MSEKKPIRRILVGLDASRISAEVQAVAAHMASFLKAELSGLFVEDINLIRLAQLPFTQEIRSLTAKPSPLDADEMQQFLRAQAALLRYELEQTAVSRELDWTFQVMRGLVTQELLRATQEADLLVLGRLSRRHALHKNIGSTAFTAVHQAAGSVLIVTPGMDFSRPVLLLYGGDTAAERVVALSLALAQASRQLHIVLLAETEAEAVGQRQVLAAGLERSDIFRAYYQVAPADSDGLGAIVAQTEPGMIVWGHGRGAPWPPAIEDLLETVDIPFLVVHGEDPSFAN